MFCQNQYEETLYSIDVRMFGGNCFYIKNMDILCQKWECLACKQILCNKRKTNLFSNEKKFKCFLNSNEKVANQILTNQHVNGMITWVERQVNTYITRCLVKVVNV